jgi:hypothetical protein
MGLGSRFNQATPDERTISSGEALSHQLRSPVV